MKLQELMEASVVRHLLGNIPVIRRTDTTAPVDFSKLKHLGTGVEADVYGTKKAGMVVKILRFPESFDMKGVQSNPFLHYVSVCLKNQNNPYFPKFKNARVYEIPSETVEHPDGPVPPDRQYHQQGDYVLIVVMEQLLGIDEVDLDDVEDLFNEHGFTMDVGKAEDDKKKRGDEALLSVRSMALTSRVNNNLKKLMKNTKKPEFHKALSILQPLFKKFGSDTHTGNLMFRETGNGLQIVFTDPLYPEDDL